MYKCFHMNITVDYNLYGKITHVLPEFEVKLLDTVFAEDVTVKLLVKTHLADKLTEKLIDSTNGSISIERLEEQYGNFA